MLGFEESLVWLGKLALAALLGGAVGFERESHGQSAGIRTNVMVAMGSCLLMMLSLHIEGLFREFDINSIIRIDPGRIASYAVAGMGFLGAGAIIKGKGSIRGLTTAAGIWMNTGIGLAIGANFFLPAIFTTLISLIVLYNLRFLKMIFPHDVFTMLIITCSDETHCLRKIRRILAEHPGIDIRFINYQRDFTGHLLTYRIRLCCKEDLPWGKIIGRFSSELPNLRDIAWEESDVP